MIFDFINALPGNISLGLIWGVMAIGLYITYKILELSDLTVDGSFGTGGAICAVMLFNGHSVWLAMLVALVGGMLCGLVTGILHTKCKIPAILAGILTQLGLYTVNLTIMDGKANLPVMADKSNPLVARIYQEDVALGLKPFYQHPIFVMVVISAVVIGALYWFFGTERGCSIRATGAKEHMARAQGINTNTNKLIGLVIANGLVAVSGALLAQYSGAGDVNMGRGAIVIGLAAIIMGDVLFGKLFKNFALKLVAVSMGAILYYIVIQMVITLIDVDSQYMKLFSALIVAIFLTVSNLMPGKKHHKVRKEAQHA